MLNSLQMLMKLRKAIGEASSKLIFTDKMCSQSCFCNVIQHKTGIIEIVFYGM